MIDDNLQPGFVFTRWLEKFAAVVLQTKDATFTPDVKIVCDAIVFFFCRACDVSSSPSRS
jgi:hypothetical protein